jgi:signal transduction histidine kinase
LVDNGKGFVLEEAKKRNGMGLRNIQTRVESYFGSMEFASAPNQGTKLFMKFPLTVVTLPEQSQLP